MNITGSYNAQRSNRAQIALIEHAQNTRSLPPICIGGERVSAVSLQGVSTLKKSFMWLDKQVSVFDTHTAQVGTPATFREIFYTPICALPHHGQCTDLDAIISLRQLSPDDTDYDTRKRELKNTLQGYTPAGLMTERKKEAVISRTGIISIDFDDLEQYDISEVKQAIGALPFVGYCGLSVSGRGLFALVLIAEPDRQREYAEHLFEVFNHYSIPPDTTKGRNVNDLRYVSYDSNPVINDCPEPLRIAIRAKKKPEATRPVTAYQCDEMKKVKAVNNAVSNINNAQIGQRFEIVRHWSYALGGFGDAGLLDIIKDTIRATPAFTGQETKYLKHAVEGFEAGSKRLFT